MSDSHTTITHQSTPARPRRSRTRPATAMAVLALAGLLAFIGCTPAPSSADPGDTPSSNGPTKTPTTTTKPSPSLSPSPTVAAVYKPATAEGPAQNVPVPVLPEKAKEFSKEGLIAFAEYWYATLGYAFETGNPEPMMTISDPGCRPCEAMAKTVIAGHSDGKWILGGRMVIGTPSTSFALAPDGTYQAITMARQENVKYFRADKTLAEDKGPKPAIADLMVARYIGGQWSAVDVSHLQGSKA